MYVTAIFSCLCIFAFVFHRYYELGLWIMKYFNAMLVFGMYIYETYLIFFELLLCTILKHFYISSSNNLLLQRFLLNRNIRENFTWHRSHVTFWFSFMCASLFLCGVSTFKVRFSSFHFSVRFEKKEDKFPNTYVSSSRHLKQWIRLTVDVVS